MLKIDGGVEKLTSRLDELDDETVRNLLERLRQTNVSARDFETAYFEQRLKLATHMDRTFVATRLRRFLATGTTLHESPRRQALKTWAQRAFGDDLGHALDTGLPRKTIVFTAWVGNTTQGEAATLQKLLLEAFTAALQEARQRYKQHWIAWKNEGRRRLEVADSTVDFEIAGTLRTLSTDELTAVLAGKHRNFVGRLRHALEEKHKAITEVRREWSSQEDKRSFEARALRRRLKDMQAALSPWNNGPALQDVERYTGNERRSTRDRVATAFREVGPPWVLVASNVGSEGIDLHTYTARIVHYDLEWNPAKMEQREGRGDRVGRRLKDKLEILYCLVPKTYDERMFHQLVARDRWHGVLLGKPASRLADDQVDAPLIDRKRLERIRLDLAPSRNRSLG